MKVKNLTLILISALMSCNTESYILKYPPYAEHFPPVVGHEDHIVTDSVKTYYYEPFIYKNDTLINEGWQRSKLEQGCFRKINGKIVPCGGSGDLCDSVVMAADGKIFQYQKSKVPVPKIIVSW